ncbi:MAG: HPr(Ser) kinase/phosphatase [Clostridia bacterium]|nr:HPr(Ser) kinase/phosphatase [Clostridia bacterium]
MRTDFSISLEKIIKEFSLEPLYLPENSGEIMVSSPEINRPGLQLAGYFQYFDEKRIQILGLSETSFLKRFTTEKARERMKEYFSRKPVAVVIARELEVEDYYKEIAQEYGVPLLKTGESTSDFSAALIAFLNLHLAPRVTQHGVLVEVYGEGILLLGESGVGKSETAIELVKRGHRLIADDAVEIRRVSSKSLVGTAPDNIRHFIELRGIGIINASRIFGVGSVKLTEKIDLVINMEPWDVNKAYDRMGLENQTTEILGLNIQSLTIPVKPGRNLAVIIEVAAMNSRQKKLGYNAAEDLLGRLGMADDFKGKSNDKVEAF